MFERSNIAAMEGYTPGEQPKGANVIKLNTNENPYPPSPAVAKAVADVIAGMRKYSCAQAISLRHAAAELYGVQYEQTIATNGSDEILRMLITMTVNPGEKVAIFSPTYTLYETLVGIQGGVMMDTPLTDDFDLPELPDMAGVRLAFLPNPNAPTGTMFSHDSIRRLCCACPGIVVVDEAYADFAQTNAFSLLRECPNMVITRTMSKSYSLAGTRVGFGFASPEIIASLMKVKDSYNLNAMSQAAAEAALRDQPYLQTNVQKIIATRTRMVAALEKMGFMVWPSAANFVLARTPGVPARMIYEELKERDILVRYFNKPRIDDCLRISVGTEAETDALLAALTDILASA